MNKIEKRVIKARHNHFTQVRNAAIVFTTEESFGLIQEYKTLAFYKNTHRAVERISNT